MSRQTIVIVDYGVGNLLSVARALVVADRVGRCNSAPVGRVHS